MQEFMNRGGGRGVTVTMIVNRLASDQLNVTRSTVRRWLADDIKRGAVERVTPGFYRLRQSGDEGKQPGGCGPGERLR
jgi:predicted transcriptional regulator of viral defense system